MPTFAHEQLRDRIIELNSPPNDRDAYANWIKAQDHLAFLQANSEESELVILAKHDCRFIGHDRTYIDSFVIDSTSVKKVDHEVLKNLSTFQPPLPCNSETAYIEEGNSVVVRRGLQVEVLQLQRQATSLAFDRMRKVTVDKDERYIDILQDYIHVSDVHWWSERSAYCRLDDYGGIEAVVSMTCDDSQEHILLASFKREPLEQYLAATNSILVRLFVFDLDDGRSLKDNGGRSAVDQLQESNIYDENIFYNQKVIPGYMGSTIGAQVIGLSRPKAEVVSSIFGRNEEGLFTEFVVWDFRNDPNVAESAHLLEFPGVSMLTEIVSTDPSTTTSYFATYRNSLPFDTSPAFFNADLLHKYKADRGRYLVEHGRLSCRDAWSIKYDTNGAGQVFAYMKHLRDLPYSEQQYWKVFNEHPKAGISETAKAYDFDADISFESSDPLLVMKRIIDRWNESGSLWWKTTDDNLLSSDFTPITDSRDEWSDAFMALEKLVISSFEVEHIRERLDKAGIRLTKVNKV